MQFLLVMMERIPSMRRYGGTNTKRRFLAEAGGSNKDFCFCLCKGKDKLNVFESAIDAMSYASMVLEGGEDWTQQTYLSLGGVYKNNQNRLPIALGKIPQRTWRVARDHPAVGS